MEATEILINEHQKIQTRLDETQLLLDKKVSDTLDDWHSFYDFITDYTDGIHHKKEEDVYFEWMRMKNESLDDGPLKCMLKDHSTFREVIASSKVYYVEFKMGNFENEDNFKRLIEYYIQILADHIFKENNILYKFAESLDKQFGGGDEYMLPKFREIGF